MRIEIDTTEDESYVHFTLTVSKGLEENKTTSMDRILKSCIAWLAGGKEPIYNRRTMTEAMTDLEGKTVGMIGRARFSIKGDD